MYLFKHGFPCHLPPASASRHVKSISPRAPCCSANNPTIQSRAKQHVVRHYAAVGIIEDLDSFFYLLEMRLPTFFTGALNAYHTLGLFQALRIIVLLYNLKFHMLTLWAELIYA